MNSQRTSSKKTLDLNKVKDIIFEDLDALFSSLDLDYRVDGDNIFMKCPIHEGSDNPNGLSMSIDRRMWRCWTRGCHEHYNTDIFGFVAGCLDTDSFSDVLAFLSRVYSFNDARCESKKKQLVDQDSKEFKTLVRQFKKSERLIIFDVGCFQGNFSRALKKEIKKKSKIFLI